jgi:hypothetical protein
VCLLAGLNAATIPSGVVATVTMTLSPSATGAAPIQISDPVEAELDGTTGAITANGASISAVAAVTVGITPAAVSLQATSTQQFTATVTGATNTAVTWSLSPSVGTISAAGLYTAPASLTAPQTVTITATSAADTSKSASATITLQPVVAVSVTPGNMSIPVSQTQQFTAAVTGATNTAVTWSLSPSVGTVSTTGLYTAPATLTAPQTVTITATSAADTSKSATALILLQPANGFAIRVNAGGPVYTDTQGRSWTADFGYAGGSVGLTNDSILGTTDPALYQTSRYSYGDFQYQFGVPNGVYSVTLKFAEGTFSQPGQRVFDVLLNDSMVLANFDMIGLGVPPLTAVDRTFPVNVTDGKITIEFDSVVNAAGIGAILITQGPPPNISVTPASASLSASQTQQFTATQGGSAASVKWSLQPAVGSITQTGLYTAPASITASQTITVSAVSTVDPSKSGTVTISLQPTPVAPFTPIRVNAGGGSYTDNNGQVWRPDTGYNGGSPFETQDSILNTTTPDLYQTQHTGDFRYHFAVPNGAYVVTLKFAEIKFRKAGKRTFNVSINGTKVLKEFDVLDSAGAAFTAIDRSFPITVTNGKVSIQFKGITRDAIVNAIQITAAQ